MTGSGLDFILLYVSVAKIYAYFKRSDNFIPSQTPPQAYLPPPVLAFLSLRFRLLAANPSRPDGGDNRCLDGDGIMIGRNGSKPECASAGGQGHAGRAPMSGHSKWSTIKRQKGAADAKRGQLFTKLAREIAVAAREGLPDPDLNVRLRIAVDRARAANMPKDNIERAIERAAGAGNTDNFDEVYYEGYGPGGTALMILALTDNRNRTVGEVRALLTRSGGTLGESGTVGWMFDRVGYIEIEANGTDPDELALVAIDAGASDVQVEDGSVAIYTETQELHTVGQALQDAGFELTAQQLTMKPKTLVNPEPDQAVKAIRLVEKLEDLDDVQEVFTNLDISDDVLALATA
jgi:YebC/PmpR family DNA-binding regulatory protein